MAPMISRLQVLQVAAALLLLNALLSFENWWPTPAIKPDFRLAPEFVGYWLVLLSLIALRGSLSSTMLKWLALVYLLLVMGRYGDVTVPALFGRSLNLYWDSYQVPIVLSVLARKVPLWIPALIVLVTVLSVWCLYRLIRWATRIVADQAVPRASRSPMAWTVTLAATVLVGFNLAGETATWPWVSKPVIPVYNPASQLACVRLFARAASCGLAGVASF